MPVHGHPQLRLPLPDDRAALDRMPGSIVPVIRQPFTAADRLPFWAYSRFEGNLCFDVDEDPGEERNLASTEAGGEMEEQLREALREIEAPDDQLTRLGFH